MTAIPVPYLPPVSPPTIAWDVVLLIANVVVGIMAVKAVSDSTKDKSDSKPDSATQECPTLEETAPAESPEIDASELEGKTRSEIKKLAEDKKLEPVGDRSSPDYPRKWKDPVTGKERLRLDRGHKENGEPYNNPNAANDHVHGYDKSGNPINVNGDKHIPTIGD